MRNLEGKRVLVSGGAMGMGREMALQFARAGARVVMTDINGEALEKSSVAIREGGGHCEIDVIDVTDRESIRAARERIRERGPLDVLVNNAGVVFGGAFLDVPIDRHVLTYEVNTVGLMAVTHAFLGDLIARPEAHVVNIASASGLIGLPFGASYASSKWAVIGFSESLRLELRRLGHTHVGVSAICPSYVGTGMFEGVKPPRLTRLLTPDLVASRVLDAVRKNKPLVFEPPQVRLVAFLRGILPVRWFDRVNEAMGVNTSMSQWRGHG